MMGFRSTLVLTPHPAVLLAARRPFYCISRVPGTVSWTAPSDTSLVTGYRLEPQGLDGCSLFMFILLILDPPSNFPKLP